MKCFLVDKDDAGQIRRRVTDLPLDDLPAGDVLIRVHYSSLNYKDALAAQGHPGVVRKLPHVPGIDAAGVVEESTDPRFSIGDEVLVTGNDLGGAHWGGWADYVRVPGDWVVRLTGRSPDLPHIDGLSLVQAMTYGTAGFTAAQCVESLQRHDITPDSGRVIVTGATGGVGSLAVMLLAHLRYEVAAVTGKADRHEWLRQLGAKEILSRGDVDDTSDKPLLKSQWAGAVDTVGGNTLATLLRSLAHRGCAAACGLVGGTDLPLTVYPFLLRGVTLDGIDSAQCPREPRERIWRHLADEWKPPQLDSVRTVVKLDELEPQIATIMAGNNTGRVVVDLL